MSFFLQRNERNKIVSGTAGQTESKSLSHELWDWTKSMLVALLVVILVHKFGFNLSTVKGSSMEPTLQEGEWLFVNKAIAYIRAPHRGEIVILHEPGAGHGQQKHPLLVKRVVAVAGDRIEGRGGYLYVNGGMVAEPYTDTMLDDGDFGLTEVPEGSVFVMGDNRHRQASSDSRRFGTVPVSLIEGRAEWVLWPFDEMSGL